MKKLILSLDPATYYTGYCLFAFDVEEHHNNKLLDFGRIVSKLSNMEKRVAEIGLKIEKYINSIFEKYKYLQFEFEVISEHYPYHTPNVACTSALAFLAGYIVSICDFKKIKMSFYLSTE
jgi:Holliday junction resolvasome RuvABC endonuclease subunit